MLAALSFFLPSIYGPQGSTYFTGFCIWMRKCKNASLVMGQHSINSKNTVNNAMSSPPLFGNLKRGFNSANYFASLFFPEKIEKVDLSVNIYRSVCFLWDLWFQLVSFKLTTLLHQSFFLQPRFEIFYHKYAAVISGQWDVCKFHGKFITHYHVSI